MNLKELHEKITSLLLFSDVDNASVKVRVHIGCGELAPIDSIRLDIYDSDGEDSDTCNLEDGPPVRGVHFDSIDQLMVVIDAEE